MEVLHFSPDVETRLKQVAAANGTDAEQLVKRSVDRMLADQARFKTEVIEVEGRRVKFRVEAWDEREQIADGTHERFVVNVERFAQRLAEKRG